MTARAKLSTRFRISIPKEVRVAQQWRAGQEFVFIPKGKGIMIMAVPDLTDLAGLARGADKRDYRDRKDRA
ncbi:MAG: AbrB/MazE/SpoVT family DNA-binding domain-containing protein [Rhizobiales bacterium]|nr:AbrB/MazE/SpoVT family DNA-binding domain-containing protein [Hyphomicrobiales bacterium]